MCFSVCSSSSQLCKKWIRRLQLEWGGGPVLTSSSHLPVCQTIDFKAVQLVYSTGGFLLSPESRAHLEKQHAAVMLHTSETNFQIMWTQIISYETTVSCSGSKHVTAPSSAQTFCFCFWNYLVSPQRGNCVRVSAFSSSCSSHASTMFVRISPSSE